MAARTKLVGFNAESIKKQMMETVVREQNERLIDYAENNIRLIGDAIMMYHSRNHMDRTGNLLDSLCYGVSYNGELVKGGFYREPQARGASWLHEWLPGDVKYMIEVRGHELAQTYLEKYGNNGGKGWKVFFAILAPYWGYWEKGFTMKSGGGASGIPRSTRFLQFAVMAQFHDKAKADLKPARVRFRCSVAKYDTVKLNNKWNRIVEGKRW